MAAVVCPETKSSGWLWFTLVVAVIALILVVIIYIFYFVEREDFLRVFEPVWAVKSVDTSNKSIDGENFTLYTITGNVGVGTDDFVTLNVPPEGGPRPGQWFTVTNLNDKTVTVRAGTNVTFQSFPISETIAIPGGTAAIVGPPANLSVAQLPGKTSWIIAWVDTVGTALNLVPGGVTQS